MPLILNESKQAESRTCTPPAIAYLVSGFPTVTETFVLYELVAMEKLGVRVELYPLRRCKPAVTHTEATRWIERAHYHPFVSLGIFRAQWRFIRRQPTLYFKTWFEVLRGTWGSLNFFLGALAIFPQAVCVAEEMMQKQIRHVHAHFANHPTVAALIIHRLSRIPFSFTARGTDIQVDRHMLKAKVEAAEFAIAVSSYNRNILIEEGGPGVRDKVHVIYGGVDTERLAPQPESRGAGTFRILCVGRFEEVKGHEILVEACRLLRDQGVAFECRLVGEGPLLSKVARQIRRDRLSGFVSLLGPRTYAEVVRELAMAHVVVSPTVPTRQGKREGIPNVLKEGMACGLPVVASQVGGIPELVDDQQTGILLPPGNAAALAAALRRLHDDPNLRRRLGCAAREKIVREFSLTISAAKRARLFLRNAGASEQLVNPDEAVLSRTLEEQPA
jgi:colanic acid/amylovoran biosynthesis glycosyltransferase